MWKRINLFAVLQGRTSSVGKDRQRLFLAVDKKYFIELVENSLASFMKMEIFKPNVNAQLFVKLEEAIS